MVTDGQTDRQIKFNHYCLFYIGKTSNFPSDHFREAEKSIHVPFLCHTVLEFDYKGLEYTNTDHGIALRIPEGAVAAGEKVHLEFSVAIYGPFGFPPNMLPISPIVWLCLMEKIDLKKPFEIAIPHIHRGITEKDIHNFQVCFAKADHTGFEVDSDGRKYNTDLWNLKMPSMYHSNLSVMVFL